MAVNIQEGAVSLVGLAVLISLIASFAALAYFYRLMAPAAPSTQCEPRPTWPKPPST